MSESEGSLREIEPYLGKRCYVALTSSKRACYLFDWSKRDDDFSMEFDDMFGDGSPEGFSMSDGDTLVPFALVGFASPDDDGQSEGVLFLDTANQGRVVHVEIDGTALWQYPQVLADTFENLELHIGDPPAE